MESGEIYYNFGQVALKLKQYDDARRGFEQAVDHSPDLWMPYFYLGRLCLSPFDRPAKGVQYFRQALARDPPEKTKQRILRLVKQYDSQENNGVDGPAARAR